MKTDWETPLSAYTTFLMVGDICCSDSQKEFRFEVLRERALVTAGGEAQESWGCNYTITHTGEKDGRLCPFVGFDRPACAGQSSWPPSHATNRHNIGHKYRGLRHQSSGNKSYKSSGEERSIQRGNKDCVMNFNSCSLFPLVALRPAYKYS